MRFRITTWLFIPFLLFLKVSSLKIKLFKNFQGCFTVQLSRFLSCFSVASLPEQLWYHITVFSVCQQLFSTFLFLFVGAVLIPELCSRLFCVSAVSSAATCYIIPLLFSDVNTYFWNFSNFLYFIFCIYFLYISDNFSQVRQVTCLYHKRNKLTHNSGHEISQAFLRTWIPCTLTSGEPECEYPLCFKALVLPDKSFYI